MIFIKTTALNIAVIIRVANVARKTQFLFNFALSDINCRSLPDTLILPENWGFVEFFASIQSKRIQ